MLWAYKFAHSFPPVLGLLPKLYVFVTSGIILLATSALNIILSVLASPNVMFPSAVIVPVACKFPLMRVSAFTIT